MLSNGVARCNVVWRTSALSAWWRCIAAARPPPRSRQLRYFGYSSRAPTLAADPPARRQSCEGRQQLHRRPTAQHGRVSCLGLRTRMLQTREARMRLSKACWEVSSCFLPTCDIDFNCSRSSEPVPATKQHAHGVAKIMRRIAASRCLRRDRAGTARTSG